MKSSKILGYCLRRTLGSSGNTLEFHIENYERSYGGSKKGRACVSFLKRERNRYSVILAMSHISGIIGGRILRDKNSSKTFNSFITDLSTFLYSKSESFRKNTYFLLDNSSIHCSNDSINLYRNLCLSIIFNAPYSPQFAFVERVISYIKRKFKGIAEGNILSKLEISMNYVISMLDMRPILKNILENYTLRAIRGQDLGD